jgi:hypothetical protein
MGLFLIVSKIHTVTAFVILKNKFLGTKQVYIQNTDMARFSVKFIVCS